MEKLSTMTTVLGAVLVLVYGGMVISPKRALAWGKRFPRSKWPAMVLTAVALIWSGVYLNTISLGPVERYKPLLWVLVPVAFGLIVTFVDELLAPRALGGLLLLIPTPILVAARHHPSQFRYVMIVLAYAMVIKGIILVLSPYMFRKSMERFINSAFACRCWGGIGIAMALFLLVLGIFVY